MSPIGWALQPLRKYAVFSGRASRAEFWWFTLFATIIYFGLAFIIAKSLGVGLSEAEPGTMAGMGGAGILFVVAWLALQIPTIAVSVRRVHDVDRSGWWVGAFYLVYALYYLLSIVAGGSEKLVQMSPAFLVVSAIFMIFMMIGGLILLLFYIRRGTDGPNRFGDDPYGNYDEVFR